MELLIVHLVLLVWLSLAAACAWIRNSTDRLLAAFALGWSNLLASQLLLSIFSLLDHPGLLFGLSIGFAGLTALVAWRFSSHASPPTLEESPPVHVGIVLIAVLAFSSLALASAIAGLHYFPQDDALNYSLPRAMLQVGSGSILPLQTADARQVLLPFNQGLIHTWAMVHHPPFSLLNSINLAGWAVLGIAIYRLCQVLGYSANASLAASGCTLAALPVLAQAATSAHGLPAIGAFIGATAMLTRWSRDGDRVGLFFGSLLAGLAAGSTQTLLALVAVLGLLAFVRGFSPRGRNRWLASLTLGLGLLPFLVNIVITATRNFSPLLASLPDSLRGTGVLGLSTLQPLLVPPNPMSPPSENTVGLGLAGLACVLAALVALVGPTIRQPLTRLMAGCSLIVLTVMATLTLWFPTGSGDLVLPLALAAPSMADLMDRFLNRRPVTTVFGLIIAIAVAWSASLYLLHNAHRPLAPLLYQKHPAPSPSLLPALLAHRLSMEERIQFSSDDPDNLLVLLMGRQQRQRFDLSDSIASDAYNVISRPSAARDRTLRQLAEGPLYTLIAFEGKPTAGVELLGSVRLGPIIRDYLGISGSAGQLRPIPSNRTLLVTLSRIEASSGPHALKIDLKGLNPRDQARLEIWHETAADSRELIATFVAEGRQSIPLPADLHRLRADIVSTNDGQILGAAILGDDSRQSMPVPEDDPSRIFWVELVSTDIGGQIKVGNGLTSPEGPFPQWSLPLIRWARKPVITMDIPEAPGVERIRLQFSARLHIRPQAAMEIRCNGVTVMRVEFTEPLPWKDVSLEFAAVPGINHIELRDIPPPAEPDWADYLARYPDVRRHIEIVRQQPREGAIEHFQLSGQREGRTMRFVEPPSPAEDAFFFMFRSVRIEGLRRE